MIKFGLEFELEFKSPHKKNEQVDKWFKSVMDPSLRYNGVELVLREPQTPVTAAKATNYVLSWLRAMPEGQPLVTGHAGTHIHIDMRRLSHGQRVSYLLLCHILEPYLMANCGEFREGNLFTVSLSDSAGQLGSITRWTSTSRTDYLDDNNLRYSVFNVTSLPRHGSLEFRGLGSGIENIGKVEDLLTMFTKMFIYVRTPDVSAVGILHTASDKGLEYFINKFIPETFSKPDLMHKVQANMRLAQEYVYAM